MGKNMEQQLQDQIAQVSAEHDVKHDANSGFLLDNLKAMDAQLRGEMANMADAHGAKSDQHAANLQDLEKRLFDEIQRISRQQSEFQADMWTKLRSEEEVRTEEGSVERQVRTKEVQELWTMSENLRRLIEDAEGLGVERNERMRDAADVRSRLDEMRLDLIDSRKEVSGLSFVLHGLDLNNLKSDADDIRGVVRDLADTSALQGQKLQELTCSFE